MHAYVWHGYYFLRVYIVSLCGQDFLVWEWFPVWAWFPCVGMVSEVLISVGHSLRVTLHCQHLGFSFGTAPYKLHWLILSLITHHRIEANPTTRLIESVPTRWSRVDKTPSSSRFILPVWDIDQHMIFCIAILKQKAHHNYICMHAWGGIMDYTHMQGLVYCELVHSTHCPSLSLCVCVYYCSCMGIVQTWHSIYRI